MVIAIFFLSVGQCTICDTSNRHANTVLDSGLEPDSLGIRENFDTRDVSLVFHNGDWRDSKGSTFLSAETQVGITHVAIVFANITSEGLFMMAVNNDSLLNAKYNVFVLAQQDIIVNGVHMNSGTVQKWTVPFPSLLGITHNGTYYQVRLRQVSSLDDIDDPDRPANLTAEYSSLDMAYITIAGIPATLASLGFWVVVIVLTKTNRTQEGLPDGI